MDKLRRSDYHYTLNSLNLNVHKIHLYDDTGIIHTISDNDIKDSNGEKVDQLSILQVLKLDKSFKKENTKQDYINKQMKKQINFSFISDKKYESLWQKFDMLELFLYVDNEYIKVIKSEDKVIIRPNNYDFTRSYDYYNVITFEVDGELVTHSESTDYKVIADEKLQEQAKKIFDECIYPIAYIQQSEFNRIFNEYKLVKRDKPLLAVDK